MTNPQMTNFIGDAITKNKLPLRFIRTIITNMMQASGCTSNQTLGGSGALDTPTSRSPTREERAGERRPEAALVCHSICAPLPNPLPALRWRGKGEASGGSVKMRPDPFTPRQLAWPAAAVRISSDWKKRHECTTRQRVRCLAKNVLWERQEACIQTRHAEAKCRLLAPASRLPLFGGMTCPRQFVRWRQQAICLAGSLMVIAFSCFAQPETGDIVFQTDFEGAGTLRAWGAEQNQIVRLAPGFQSAQSLAVERQTNTAGYASVSLPLPIDKMRGARLACRAMVRADGVTPPPQPWNGIKFMLHITTPSGALWPQQNNLFGMFDWKRVQFKAFIPPDATTAELVLGLEAVNGRARFDDLKITVVQGPLR